MTPLSPEAYAVIEGRHSDPFRYLGPHVEAGGAVVRVFLPNAVAVTVVDDQGRLSDLSRIHDAGLFAGRLADGSSRYRLRVRFADHVVAARRSVSLSALPVRFRSLSVGRRYASWVQMELSARPRRDRQIGGTLWKYALRTARRILADFCGGTSGESAPYSHSLRCEIALKRFLTMGRGDILKPSASGNEGSRGKNSMPALGASRWLSILLDRTPYAISSSWIHSPLRIQVILAGLYG
jgi:hypothetical protein